MNEPIPIRVVETGQVYPSLRAAVAATLGRDRHGRDYDYLTSGRPIGGLHFLPEGEDPKHWFQPPPPPAQGRRRPVRCIETGVVFPSMSDAARAMHVAPATIHRAIHTRRPCCGHRWEYANHA